MNLFINIILALLQIYLFFIFINIFLTWVPTLYNYRFFRICKKISDWYLGPFHGFIVIGPFDFTPILGITIYEIILGLVYNTINGI